MAEPKDTGQDDQDKTPPSIEDFMAQFQKWSQSQGGVSSTGIDSYYPAREVYASGEEMRKYGLSYFTSINGVLSYRGESLIDEKNRIARAPYSPDDVTREFMLATPSERARLLNAMVSYGMYSGNARPSAIAMEGKGMTDDDIRAMDRFLSQANTAGRTWKGFMPILEGTVRPVVTGGGGARIAFDDAARIYREESFRALGRAPTAEETRRAVQYMQASNANPTTAAEKQAGMISPDESTAKLMGDGISRMMELI